MTNYRDGSLVDLLDGVRAWELTAARWTLVYEALVRISAALEAHDPEALRDAQADVEILSARRVVEIGSDPVGPAPDHVREIVRELVHSVGGDPRPVDDVNRPS